MGEYRKYIKFGALVALAAALIWWFGRGLDWSQVRNAVRRSDWRLIIAACAVILAAYLFRAFRWQAFLKPLCQGSLREIWIATTVGFGAVLLIGRAGEVVRPVVLPMRDRRVRPAASFVTIIIERIYDSMTIVFVFAANLLWFRPATEHQNAFVHVRQAGLTIVLLGVIAITALVLFRLKSQPVINWVQRRLESWPRVPDRLGRAVVALLDQLGRALSVLSRPRDLAVTIGWTVLLWGGVAAGNLIIFWAFGLQVAGRPFGIKESLFVLAFSMIGSAVPTPGGAAGAFHAATGAGLVFLGVEKEQAAAVAIVLHLIDFGPAALFGLFYFLRGDIDLARLRELVRSDAVEHAVEDEKIAPDPGVKAFQTEGVE